MTDKEIENLRAEIAALRAQVEWHEAVVAAARALAASTNSERNSIDAAVVVLRRLNDLREALAAPLDHTIPTKGDAE